MAFIYNKKSKVTVECNNEDAIRSLMKDDNYIITESKEEKESVEKADAQETDSSVSVDLKKMTAAELKALAKEKGFDEVNNLTKAELIAMLSE